MSDDKIRNLAQRWMKRFHSDDTAELSTRSLASGEREKAIRQETIDQILKLLIFVRDQEDEGLESLRQKLVEWRDSLIMANQ